ncbi:MAG TPA: hypothetical protein ENI07_17525 [Desulfobacterales bacterium]|nr:hypothetical protein [Desulfobacterales bacterium]
MKIDKYIDFSQEIEIELSSEDIYLILSEDAESVPVVLQCLNSVASFLKGVPEARIAEMTNEQKTIIRDFLSEQSGRYNRSLHSE